MFAAENAADDVNVLNDEIEEKRVQIEQINRKIDSYKEKIDAAQDEEITLFGEVALLENRIAKTELDIEATNMDIDAVQLEIAVLEHQISELEAKLERQRVILSNILRRINEYDDDTVLELVFGTESFSELFDQLRYLEEVNSDLDGALEEAKLTKENMETQQSSREERLGRLVGLEDKLKVDMLHLENEISAKEVLISEVQYSEAQFATLMYELRQEEQYIDQQVASLQREIESKLYANDELGGDSSILSWPADPSYRGISAYFHDPTYPFRHLFEHSGIDIPAPQGTPLKSPAPGYVAWVRQGQLYGNYIMIVHTDGIATLYAHLSKPLVQPDQFVSRGETIALSGGMPGTSGAGLSTGPHLHFEVRLNGIPVNPLNYLTDY
ncbi:peptidoglycan DD-metalloendopeptidase family protein [Patescibacteria group bacterium]|nr:peptidoglycan DD-metalloendopeptidase family protein [Patescibacteria group bacterium]